MEFTQSSDNSAIRQNPAALMERSSLPNKREQDLNGTGRHLAEAKCLEISDDPKESSAGIVLNLADAKGHCDSTLNHSYMEDLFKTRTDGPEIHRKSDEKSCVLSTCHENETESLQKCSGLLPMKGDTSCNYEDKWASSLSEHSQESNESTMVQTQESMKEYCYESFNKPTMSPELKKEDIVTLIAPTQNEHGTNQGHAKENCATYENKNDSQVESISNEIIAKSGNVKGNANISFKEVNCFWQGDSDMAHGETVCIFKNLQNMCNEDIKIGRFISGSISSNNLSSKGVFKKAEQYIGDSSEMNNDKAESKAIHAKETCDQIGQYVERERDQQIKTIAFERVQKIICNEHPKNESLNELWAHLKLNIEQDGLCSMPGESPNGCMTPENLSDGQEVVNKMLVFHDKSNREECNDNSDPLHQTSHSELNSDGILQTLIEQVGLQDRNNVEKDSDSNGPRVENSEERYGQHIKRSQNQQVENLKIKRAEEFQEVTCITSNENESVNVVPISYTQDICTTLSKQLHVFPNSENVCDDEIVVESLISDSHNSNERKECPANIDPTFGASHVKYFPTSNSHQVLEAGLHDGESDGSSSNDNGPQHSLKKQYLGHTDTKKNRENEYWDVLSDVPIVGSAMLKHLDEDSENNARKNLTVCDRLVAQHEVSLKRETEDTKERVTETSTNKTCAENNFLSEAYKIGEGSGCLIIETETEEHSIHMLAKKNVEHFDCDPNETVIVTEPVKTDEAVQRKDFTNSSFTSHEFIPAHEVSHHQNTPLKADDQEWVSGIAADQSSKFLVGEMAAKLTKDAVTNFTDQISLNDLFIQQGQGVRIHPYLPEATENENSFSKSKYDHSDQQISGVRTISEAMHQNSKDGIQSPGNIEDLHVSSCNICSSQLFMGNVDNDFSTVTAAQNHSTLTEKQNVLKEAERLVNIDMKNHIVYDKKTLEFTKGTSEKASTADDLLHDDLLIGHKHTEKKTHGENIFDIECGKKVTCIDNVIPEQPLLLPLLKSQSMCCESKENIITAEDSKEFSKGPSTCHPDEPRSIATDGLCQHFTEYESSTVKSEGNSAAIQTNGEEMKGNVDCSIIDTQHLKHFKNPQSITHLATHREKCTKNRLRTESSYSKCVQQPAPSQMAKARQETFSCKSKCWQAEFPGKKKHKSIAAACDGIKQTEGINDAEYHMHIHSGSRCYSHIRNGNATVSSLPNLTHCSQKSSLSFKNLSVQNARFAASSKTGKGSNLKLCATQEKNAPLVAGKLVPPSSVPKRIPQFQEKLSGIKNKESALFKSVNNILSSRNDSNKKQKLTCNHGPAILPNAAGPDMDKIGQSIIGETEKSISKVRPQRCKVEKKDSFSKYLNCITEKPSMAVEILPNKKDIKGQDPETDSLKDHRKAPRLLKDIQAETLPDFSGNMKLCCHFCEIHGDSTVTWTKDSKLLARVHKSPQDDSPVSLTIVQTSKKDQGLYQCSLKNKYGKVTAEFNLTTEALDNLSTCQAFEGGEEIEFNQLLFREDFICDKYFGGNLHGKIVTEELHFGEGVHRKAFRSKVMYGLVPMFSPGHLCVLKVHNAIAYGTKTKDELVQKNYRLAVQECYVQNTAREYAKIYAAEAEPLKEFGDVPEIIPIFLIHRPANNIPYATVEEELIGEFVKYSIRDGKEINFKRTDSEAGQKCCTFQHWVYQKTNGNLLVTDMQGVGMKLTDVGIATLAKGYKGFKGNCPISFIDQFKVLHQCNKYCEMLGLKPLQLSLHRQRKPKPVETGTPPNSSKLPKAVLCTQSKHKL